MLKYLLSMLLCHTPAEVVADYVEEFGCCAELNKAYDVLRRWQSDECRQPREWIRWNRILWLGVAWSTGLDALQLVERRNQPTFEEDIPF